jgi:hypothetical protein
MRYAKYELTIVKIRKNIKDLLTSDILLKVI